MQARAHFAKFAKQQKWPKNADSRLQFLRDVPSENDVFDGVGSKSATPFGAISGPNFEAIVGNKIVKKLIVFPKTIFLRFWIEFLVEFWLFFGALGRRKSDAMSFATRLVTKPRNLENYCILQ